MIREKITFQAALRKVFTSLSLCQKQEKLDACSESSSNILLLDGLRLLFSEP